MSVLDWRSELADCCDALAQFAPSDVAVHQAADRSQVSLAVTPMPDDPAGRWQALFSASLGQGKLLDVLGDLRRKYPTIVATIDLAAAQYRPSAGAVRLACSQLDELLEPLRSPEHPDEADLETLAAQIRALYELDREWILDLRGPHTTPGFQTSSGRRSQKLLRKRLDAGLGALHVYLELLAQRDDVGQFGVAAPAVLEAAVRAKLTLLRAVEDIVDFPMQAR